MQKKTIKTVITKKLEDWLDSITDENLKKEVKSNLLVSGGSIASMFLNEKVNDFDIYLNSMDTLIKLAKYYCPSIRVLDGRKRDQYLKDEFPGIIDGNFPGTTDKYTSGLYVLISNLKKDQIKMQVTSAGQRFTTTEDPNYEVAFVSQNAISLTNDIQIVLRFSGTNEEIHKTFDFIHATNYFTFKDGLVTNKEAIESLLSKDLKYQGSFYPLTSIIRMKKFLKRGWVINAGEILKIMFQISELDLKDIEVLEEQLIGVDVAYFSTLVEILRGVKHETITSSYLNTIIDKVFNSHDDEDFEE